MISNSQHTTIEQLLKTKVAEAILQLYNHSVDATSIAFDKTRKEFPGDITLLVFPFVKISRQSPEETARQIGDYLIKSQAPLHDYNIVKGFLNLTIAPDYLIDSFYTIARVENYGIKAIDHTQGSTMVEYSSPNTNKPLHLGHIRNNLLGYSISKIIEANGQQVIKANLVNDRGIHICKSMLAWKKWGNGETPQSSNLKGDHLVGKYYVEFDKQLKLQLKTLKQQGLTDDEALKQAPLTLEVQEMLRKWEDGDPQVKALWQTMNSWVYEGFAKTYQLLGVAFDKTYYESTTYLLGKELVEQGLEQNVFERKPDGSVRIDLTNDGLDEKVLLRSDGTSVYMTQDLGTARERFLEFPQLKRLIYTVGNEQDYHFKVLFLVLKKLGYTWAENCYHLSYGMVELPDGKMKSREGTVVDADDLIHEMIATAERMTKELGKTESYSPEEAHQLYHQIALGALKYFILKVDPKKKMLFNPEESIDFNGNTGPFIQYTYARIRSILRKSEATGTQRPVPANVSSKELGLIKRLLEFPTIINHAARDYNPGVIANYTFELAKEYNQFYHEFVILKEPDETIRNFRLALSTKIAEIIKNALSLLGIEVPEKM